VALKNPLTFVVIRPQDAAGLEFQVQPMLTATAESRLSGDERMQQAARSLEWLGAMAAGKPMPTGAGPQFYNVQRAQHAVETALQVPALTPLAAPLLADLGRPEGQRALVNLASQSARPLEMRQAAAAAFRRAVDRYGILLTTVEMARQYDLYNLSETQPKESQDVFSSILDTLESRLPSPPATSPAEPATP
jgi:hypothetical protein